MTAPVFVDTNVLVYARDAGAGKKQAAARGWMEELWRSHDDRLAAAHATGRLTPQKLQPAATSEPL